VLTDLRHTVTSWYEPRNCHSGLCQKSPNWAFSYTLGPVPQAELSNIQLLNGRLLLYQFSCYKALIMLLTQLRFKTVSFVTNLHMWITITRCHFHLVYWTLKTQKFTITGRLLATKTSHQNVTWKTTKVSVSREQASSHIVVVMSQCAFSPDPQNIKPWSQHLIKINSTQLNCTVHNLNVSILDAT